MKSISISTIEIEINDERIVEMMECVTMETNQEVLIRNKKETVKLSKRIFESSEQRRRERYLEAIADNDRLYLNNVYESLSMRDLIEIIHNKTRKYI